MISRRVLLSVVCGIALTAITALAARVAFNAGSEGLSHVLFWPNSVLQLAVPCNNIGTPFEPICEGTPLNVLAYFGSFLLAVIVYSSLSFCWLRARSSQAPNTSLERTRGR